MKRMKLEVDSLKIFFSTPVDVIQQSSNIPHDDCQCYCSLAAIVLVEVKEVFTIGCTNELFMRKL